jgi:site-specific DNA recombinase
MLNSVAIYARVSSDRQARDNTIASQLAALRERVTQDGCTCSDTLCFADDGCSGSTLQRPELERLRDAAANGLFDRLYVLAPDRLARRQAHQALLLDELQRGGVAVVFLNRAIGASAEDELLVQVQGVIAEYERAKIQERSRRGKRHAAQCGAVSVFSKAPYGYGYIAKTSTTPARLAIVADEATVVQSIFAWVAHERCSIREVCRRLKKQRILTRGGRRDWEPATVRGMLRNPAYIGQAAYGKTGVGERRPRLRPQRGRPEVPRRPGVSYAKPPEEWIRVAVPPVISAELFAAVAEQLRENRRRHRARQSGAGHLLQGLVVCQNCGYACYGQSAQSSAGRAYGYYRCIGTDRRRSDGQRLCPMPTVPLPALETAVWDDVNALLRDPSRIQAEYERRVHEQPAPSPQREQLEQRWQHTKRGFDRLVDAYRDGLLDKAEFEPRARSAKQRLSELESEVKLIAERETQDQKVKEVIERLEQFAKHVHHSLDAADTTVRRDLIRALVKRVEVGSNEVRVVYRIDLRPFDQGPGRGHLRHWVGRLDAAFFPFERSQRKKAASSRSTPSACDGVRVRGVEVPVERRLGFSYPEVTASPRGGVGSNPRGTIRPQHQ